MGLVSCSEDNEELLLHRQQICDRIDKIKDVFDRTAIVDPNTVEKQLQRFRERMVSELDKMKEQVSAAFINAQQVLRDPNVRIVQERQKRSKQIEGLRNKLQKAEADLAACRAARVPDRVLQRQLRDAQIQNALLREKLDWSMETKSIKPLVRNSSISRGQR